VAQGTHAELLATSPTYRETAEFQLALDEQP
jgi:ATP-binding cassette subfamily B protein